MNLKSPFAICKLTLLVSALFVLVVCELQQEVTACGKGDKKGGWGGKKEKGGKKGKKEKKAKSVRSSYRYHGYDDDDDDYEPYVKSSRFVVRNRQPAYVETRYVEVPRYIQAPASQQPFVQASPYKYIQPTPSAYQQAPPVQSPYELQRVQNYAEPQPLRETIEYTPLPRSERYNGWPSRHPILSSLIRKIAD